MKATSMSDELEKLSALHANGKLSDDEFRSAKRRVIENVVQPTFISGATPNGLQQLKRSLTDRWIGGVCGGLAEATSIPTWSWRILFLLAILLNGIGILMYVLMWIFVPLAALHRVAVDIPRPIHRTQ
ncbi:MAG: PspC domain-containing protein [Gammaproteobacteria bacterium]|nr:PspC domain-containing protein [Gammaproteobacteria bacterium]